MAHLARRLEVARALVAGGDLREVGHVVATKAWGNATSLGLRRDLTIPFKARAGAVPISVRLLREDDIPSLLSTETPGLSVASRRERISRMQVIKAGFSSCYVAVTEDDRPCYMQWLIGPDENALLKDYFGTLFPTLAPDEALLEGAFTPEHFRGKGIMPCAMAQIAEKASQNGARWVITYVDRENIPSLKGCKRAGFVPFQLREEGWELLHHRTRFSPLPVGTPYPFDVEQTPAKR